MGRAVPVVLLLLVAAQSARAQHWLAGDMAEAGPHPRAVIRSAERTVLQERIEREPYRTLFARVHAAAVRDHDPFDTASGATQLRANSARAAAFLYFLNRTMDAGAPAPFATIDDRRALGDKAALYLTTMSTERVSAGTHLETRTSQEVHLWAETLDLLLGTDPDVLGADRDLAVQNVADLAAGLYAAYDVDLWLGERSTANNHMSKTAGALGIAAVVLNGESFEALAGDGRYEPALWIDFAVRGADLVLRDFLSDADAGFSEGGSYMAYSAIEHVPFMWAWHRYTSAASYAVDIDKPVPPHFAFAAVADYEVTDPWTDPWHERNTLWAVRVMQPDGTFPPFDDCTPGSRYFFGALARPEFAHGPLFRWAWERTGLHSSGSVDASSLLLATFDDSVEAAPPEAVGLAEHQVLPFAGQVVFRSDWSTEAVYALMLAEHGPAMGWGRTRWGDLVDGVGGHEHPDPGQVIIHAFGEPLLIDGGYLGWDNHHLVNGVTNHNIVLVDGEGPEEPHLRVPDITTDDTGRIVPADMRDEGGWVPGRDGAAYIVASDVGSAGLAFAEMSTTYDVHTRATWRRGLVFLRERFVVLRDRVWTDEGDTHTVTVQLHGNGGGTSGGSYDDGTWAFGGARLESKSIAWQGESSSGTRETDHDAGGWDRRTHTVLDLHLSGADQPAERITVLAPMRASDPPLEELPCTDCLAWAWEDTTCYVRRDIEAPVVADAGIYCEDGEQTMAGLFWRGDTELTAKVAPSGWRVAVHRGPGDVEVRRIEGLRPDGACAVEDVGDRWRITVPAGGVAETRPVARDVVAHLRIASAARGDPLVTALGDEVELRADQTCSLTGSRLRFDFELTRKPEYSYARLTSRGALARIFPDLPGVYAVRVYASDDGASTDTFELAFKVEGEGWLELPDDDTERDSSGCECTQLRSGWLLLVVLLARRRSWKGRAMP